MDDTRAVFWIANEEKYIHEAMISAGSVKRQMPDLTTILATPTNASVRTLGVFDRFVDLPEPPYVLWFLNSVYYTHYMVDWLHDHGVDHALYLDTDTYMCNPVYDLFRSYFTIAGAHAPGRKTSPTFEDVPEFFPEINIGVNMMYTPHARALWKAVYKLYLQHQDVYGNNDQGVLREVLWLGRAYQRYSLYVLPPEYNMRLFPAFVCKEVKILHGRSDEDYQSICNKINASKGMRLWYKNQVLGE